MLFFPLELILLQAPPTSLSNLRTWETLTACLLKRGLRASPAVTTLINLDFNDTNVSSRHDDARQEDVPRPSPREWRSPLSQL